MRIVIATEKPFASSAIESIKKKLEKEGHSLFVLEKYKDKEELLKSVSEADALIVRSDKIDKEIISSSQNLKIIVRAGSGYDNIDVKAASERGVIVMNTPGQNSNAVAELIFGLLLYYVRNKFSGKAGTELKNKTIGFLAFGNVAQNAARIAKGFGMKVVAFSPTGNSDKIRSYGIKAVEQIEDLFTECDIISLHIPLTDKTRECINENLLIKMKQNAILVNTARKEIINEESLLKVFSERNDLSYLTDLMMNKKEEAFSLLDGRYLSTAKKMGAQTYEANNNAGIAAAQQIIQYFKNGDVTFQVN